MTSNRDPRIEIDSLQWSGFFDELQSESDRGATILASVWIENLLERKLGTLFTKGNSKTRQKLYDLNGPFSSFSSKILAAYSLGWIDSDIFNDINLVRKIRNEFAHKLHGIDLESSKIRGFIDKFKIPYRYYYDWNKLQATATVEGRGVIIFAEERPDHAGDELDIQRLRYQLIISLLVTDISTSLGLAIRHQKPWNETDPN